MSSAEGYAAGGWQRLAELQSGLLGQIEAAEIELGQAESLDEEQRAEIHVILQALKHDSLSHAAIIQSLARNLAHA